jgi:hypothetical protein
VKGAKAKRWDICYQTRDQCGWEFITTSKKLALQVNKVGILFDARGFNGRLLVHCVNTTVHVKAIQMRFLCAG